MSKKITAILQARFSSQRLPGKVLTPILGKPMLYRQIERIQACQKIDNLIVATSISPTDDPIAQFCESEKLTCFRGNLDDVLDRFYQAAKEANAKHVMRLTGDCPLIDPQIMDEMITTYLSGDWDYVTNRTPPTFPDGLDVEIMSFACLETTWKIATLTSDREHVTPYIYRRTDTEFKIKNIENPIDLSNHRWTVDEPSDIDLVRHIYDALYPTNKNFNMKDILDFLDKNPQLISLNHHIERNQGYRKSLEKDKNHAF